MENLEHKTMRRRAQEEKDNLVDEFFDSAFERLPVIYCGGPLDGIETEINRSAVETIYTIFRLPAFYDAYHYRRTTQGLRGRTVMDFAYNSYFAGRKPSRLRNFFVRLGFMKPRRIL